MPARKNVDDQPLVQRIAHAWPAATWADVNVLAAVSGGADSVALLRALAMLRNEQARGQLLAAHFNHRLRGEESEADAAWVGQLCGQLGIPIIVGQAEADQTSSKSEESARYARYAFLHQAAQQVGARYVATAHTRDDQVETVLFRLLRGSGLAGMSGMPRVREIGPSVTLVRPMLDVTRQEVEAFLSSLGQNYREDKTNRDSQYTRNWIRHKALPMLRERMGGADDALFGLSGQAAEAQALIARQAEGAIRSGIKIDDAVTLKIDKLRDTPAIVLREACKLAWRCMGWPEQAMGRRHWEQIAALVTGPANATPVNLPGSVRAVRQGDVVVLAPV